MEQTQATETPVAIPVETKPESSITPEQFSKLARQEKFIASERARIEEAKKAFESDKSDVERYRSLKGKDPFEILEHFGVDYDKLVQADNERRANPMDVHTRKALAEVDRLRKEIDEKDANLEKERVSRAEVKLMSLIDSTIQTNEYDLIEKLGEQAAVREYLEEMFHETGKMPSIKDACDAVTNHLVDQFYRVKDSKWLKPKEVAVPVEETVQIDHTPKKSETLSNKMTQSRVSQDRPMTERERLQAAMAVLGAK